MTAGELLALRENLGLECSEFARRRCPVCASVVEVRLLRVRYRRYEAGKPKDECTSFEMRLVRHFAPGTPGAICTGSGAVR